SSQLCLSIIHKF
ncbi:unnamed protein product, partial [Rotaria magnacalcarata]